MANLPPEVSDAFQELVDTLNRTRTSFDDYHDDIERVQAANNRLNEQERATRKKALDDLTSDISKVGGNLLNFGKSMSTPQGAFQAMGDVAANVVKGLANLASGFGKLGAVIKGLGEVGAEAIKFLTAETGKAFAVFGKLSQTGVVENFAAMREASRTTGLTFEQLESVISKNSESLALFGGSAIQGSKNLQQVIKFNRDAAVNMQKMGVGFQEFAEIQAGYVAEQTKAGFAQGKTNKELAAGAAKYAEELVVLTRLTGKNREELQRERDKLMTDARYRAKLSTLDEATAKRFRDIIQSMPESMKTGMKDFLAAGGVANKEAAELAVQLGQMGIPIEKFGADIMSGKMSAQQAQDMINQAAPQFIKNTAQLVATTGTDSPFGRAFVDIADRMQQHKTSQEELIQTEKKRVEEQKKLGDPTAEVAAQTQQLAVKIGLFATETERLMEVNKKIAAAMNQFLDILDKAIKGDMSGAAGAVKGIWDKMDLSDILLGALGIKGLMGKTGGVGGAAGAAGTAGQAAGTLGKMGMMSRLGMVGMAGAAGYGVGTLLNTGINKATSALTGKPGETFGGWLADKFSDTRSAAPAPAAAAGAPKRLSQKDLAAMGLRMKQGDVHAENSGISGTLLQLAQQVQNSIPGFGYFSGFNDKFHQERASSSKHTQGRAMDFTLQRPPTVDEGRQIISQLKSMGANLVIDEYNNPSSKATAGHIHAEVAMARGGIIDSTPSGTSILAGEGGFNEAIVPLPDGRSIPVVIKNTGEQAEYMGRVFDRLGEKMDTLISLMAQNAKYSRNIAQNTT